MRTALSLLLCLFATLALAQQPSRPPQGQQRPPATQPAPSPTPAPEPPPTVYEPDMLKLAEIIGSLAFLRELCGEDGQAFRRRMEALIEAEGTTPGRRDRMAGAYNRGYRAFALNYRTCTPAAEEAKARLAADGERLSRALAGRFGG